MSAEIAAVVAEKAFKYLKAPVKRVALPDVPTPNSPVLEDAYYFDYKRIVNCVIDMFKGV